MRSVAIIGASTCSYQEMSACLNSLTQNIRAEGLNILCSEDCVLNATKYSIQERTEITYVLGDAERILSDADCIVIFWDGSSELSAKVAELAKQKGKQLRIHRTKDIVATPPKRSIVSVLTGNKE